VNLKRESHREKEPGHMLPETNMKDNGRRERRRDGQFIRSKMAQNLRYSRILAKYQIDLVYLYS